MTFIKLARIYNSDKINCDIDIIEEENSETFTISNTYEDFKISSF